MNRSSRMFLVWMLLGLRTPALLGARALTGCIEMILHELENLVTRKSGGWRGKAAPPNLFCGAGRGIGGSSVSEAFGVEAAFCYHMRHVESSKSRRGLIGSPFVARGE